MAMAISTSSDCCSLPVNNSSTTSHNFLTLFPTCKNLPFLNNLPSSNLSLFHVNSSGGCRSPILEDASTNMPIFEFSQDSQELAGKSFDGFLNRLLQDPETQELAYEYYKKAKENPEFKPGKQTLKLLIRYLIRSEKWDSIVSLSEDFKIYDVFPDADTCSRLVYICITAGKIKVAESLLQVFMTEGEIALLIFHSAMKGYNNRHMHRSTIVLYQRMKSSGIVPDSGCYCQIMEAYTKRGYTQEVVDLFQEFETRKLDATPFVLTKIYRTLFESLGKSGRAFEALNFFRDMTRKGISGDSCIYSSLVRSFASIGEVKIAEELFKEAEERGMLRDPEVFLKLVLVYIEQDSMEKTLEIIASMKRAKIKASDCVLCAIVNGFCKRRGYRTAVEVYEKLISEGYKPGQVTYASIINAYYRIGFYSEAEKVFQEMQQKGFDKCVVAYSTMVAMFGKTERITDAMRLVAVMKAKGCEPNVWIYNALMAMHGKAKNLRQVEKLWKEMKRRKVKPDKVSYTSVISAYNKAKEYEMCEKFYNEYRMNGGKIDKAMAGIMAGVFSKLSRIDELLTLWKDMNSEGVRPDERLKHSVFNALRDAGIQVLQQNFEGS